MSGSSKVYALKKPCEQCPFARHVTPGGTGGTDPSVYIGQAVGPFWLPCHMDPNYQGAGQFVGEDVVAQCGGAAHFRANLGVDSFMPMVLHRRPRDFVTVFATPAELIAHHRQIPLAEAEAFLEAHSLSELLQIEFDKIKGHPEKVKAVPTGKRIGEF